VCVTAQLTRALFITLLITSSRSLLTVPSSFLNSASLGGCETSWSAQGSLLVPLVCSCEDKDKSPGL
jgi:hypothetical protein